MLIRVNNDVTLGSTQASQNFGLGWESTGLPYMNRGSPAPKAESPIFGVKLSAFYSKRVCLRGVLK